MSLVVVNLGRSGGWTWRWAKMGSLWAVGETLPSACLHCRWTTCMTTNTIRRDTLCQTIIAMENHHAYRGKNRYSNVIKWLESHPEKWWLGGWFIIAIPTLFLRPCSIAMWVITRGYLKTGLRDTPERAVWMGSPMMGGMFCCHYQRGNRQIFASSCSVENGKPGWKGQRSIKMRWSTQKDGDAIRSGIYIGSTNSGWWVLVAVTRIHGWEHLGLLNCWGLLEVYWAETMSRMARRGSILHLFGGFKLGIYLS